MSEQQSPRHNPDQFGFPIEKLDILYDLYVNNQMNLIAKVRGIVKEGSPKEKLLLRAFSPKSREAFEEFLQTIPPENLPGYCERLQRGHAADKSADDGVDKQSSVDLDSEQWSSCLEDLKELSFQTWLELTEELREGAGNLSELRR